MRYKVRAAEHSTGRLAAEARREVGRLKYLKYDDDRIILATKNPRRIGGIITFEISIVAWTAVIIVILIN
jgi:hypothetical protein